MPKRCFITRNNSELIRTEYSELIRTETTVEILWPKESAYNFYCRYHVYNKKTNITNIHQWRKLDLGNGIDRWIWNHLKTLPFKKISHAEVLAELL